MLSAKCGSSGVKIWHSQFYSIADRSRGGECGVFPAHAASAAGGSAPRSNAARSGYLGGFLVLSGLPGSDQDIHKVGQEVERAEVRVGPALNLMSSRTRACAREGPYDANGSPRGQVRRCWIPPTTAAVQSDLRSLSRTLLACEFGMTSLLEALADC